MTQSIQEERYRWILPIIEKRLTYDETLKICPHSKRSLERWVSAYKKHGVAGLVPKSTEPKTQPGETSIEIKEQVIALRKKTGLCAKKLHWRLAKRRQHHITHYLIDPGKPAQNGTVERSHREDEEKFYQKQTFKTKGELKRKIRLWNEYYNDLEHCSLDGKTPNEVLYSKPPEVRT